MKIKVCGMKFLENIQAISDLEPDYLGFIFYEKSERNFDKLMPEIPSSIHKVGVFVNESISKIKEKVNEFNLNIVQLHGTESSVYLEELKKKLPEIIIWKVFSIGDEFDFNALKMYENADAFLLDTKGKNHGGNGFQFDWKILENYKMEKNIILSGGISAEDVLKIKALKSKIPQIEIVDINSRFETEPGRKNVELIKKFMNELKIEKSR